MFGGFGGAVPREKRMIWWPYPVYYGGSDAQKIFEVRVISYYIYFQFKIRLGKIGISGHKVLWYEKKIRGTMVLSSNLSLPVHNFSPQNFWGSRLLNN